MKISSFFQVRKYIFSLAALILCLFSETHAQQLAFPTAEGGGRFAVGGRGGSVYEVTNLNDSGVGSLRDAISQPNRTIIFKVSGEIKLKSRLVIKQNNITIAGQTAPGDGICITGYTLNISASDIIVRYLRCRFGDENASEDDAMNSWNGPYQNIIVDHCSLSWSIDETGTFYGIRNFTLQWSILSESLYNSKHDKGIHGYAGIWGGANATFHHNLLAHHSSRNPRFGGARKGYVPYDPADELVDYRNNVVYNWGNINSSYGGEGGKINMVNNYYKAGPATPGSLTTSSASNKRNRILNYTNFYVDGTDTTWGGKFYIDGNYVAGYPDVTADNWTKGVQKDSYVNADALIKAARQEKPFDTAPVRTHTAEEAYLRVLDSAGAILPRRDAIDLRITRETLTGTATYEGATYALVTSAGITHPSGIIDSPTNVGGIPKYGSNTAYTDADKDGMDDIWELANGLNPKDATDGNKIAPNGYTQLENFLNGISKDTGTGEILGGTKTVDLMGYDAVVALDGTGSHKTLQAAIDAAPVNSTAPFRIFIKNGKYLEKVNIPSNKPFIYLIGESAAKTIISWNDYSGKANPAGGTYGTSTSGTLTIKSDNCGLWNLTVENTTGDSPQALAISLEGDKTVVKSCIFLGGQDTVLSNGDGKRQYFKDTYIDGVVDFIFGSATAIFDSCIVYAKDRVDKLAGSYITAANTPTTQTYGYIFRNTILPANNGVTSYVLGRPWQNDAGTSDAAKKGNKVVFLNSIYGNKIVKPEGWSVWDAGTNTSLITYAEYKSKGFNGALADVSKRVSWSKQLTDAQALVYYDNSKIFGTWDPCSIANVCPTAKGELVMLNFKVIKGANLSTPTTFAWNTAWNMKDIQFSVYRSVDTKTNFVKIKDITSTTDTLWNYTTNDNAPEAGKTYYYVIKATKNGYKEFNTDTVSVTSLPTITLNGTPADFLQGLGAPSAAQVYTVAGENLPSALTITVPTNFEVSVDAGKTWNTSTVSLSPTSGIVATTSVLIRLNAKTAGSYTGTITHASTGAIAKTLQLTGITQTEALAFSQRLALWSMSISDADSAAVRAKGITVSKPSLKRLYLSNGSVIPAYSNLHGQAFAPSADGGGLWTTAGGGWGNNLYRGSYEQIVIKCNTDYTLRVDSLQLKTALYAAATGKFALVFSKTGFKNDSSEATAGLLAGIPLVAGANGKFTTPIIPNAEPSSTVTRYQFALNGSTGINLVAGDSLTFRLYYSTGSSSAGRYAKIKDLELLGVSKAILKPAMALTQALQDFNYMIGMTNEPQSYTVTAENLQGEIQLIPSAFFELSLDKTTWFNAASALKITPTNGMVSTKVYVRFTASTAGSYTGTITHKATGVQDITVNLKGIVTKPLGIDEIGNHALLLSPNPSVNEVQVSHPAEKAELRLIDLQGNSKVSQSLNEHTTTTTLSLQGLPSGVYLVEWSTGEKKATKKLVKE